MSNTVEKVEGIIEDKKAKIADNAEKVENIQSVADIRYLDPRKSKFMMTAGGFLSLSIEKPNADSGENAGNNNTDNNKGNGNSIEKYDRVNLHRAFPYKYPREYISVRTVDGKEIGVIRNIDDYPEETVKLFMYELDRRYFTPIIEKINSIKEEFGYSYWDVITNSGAKRFTVQNIHNNVIPINESRILVIDVDGNRFEIPDYKKLDIRSLKMVERLL